ncbi:uncharacterized protein F4822DRAFT_398907 [Hypoxylon trugodes]|uniref:uncharacterized protein n=1 Tax=Hypoxylon trugodes TaxID=326681 RepID=UPI00219362E7|nr:uncharacterized protein F4822DRAFT_398907 [Hypoxylon trugodes]KAI1389595.1 hypothetical protein F4822DRAFT_398907 [Hypoxylon trugodes]
MADGKPTLHYLQDSQAHLVLWVLEELGIEYHLVLHNRIAARSPPELKAVHPLGKSPTLVTPSGRVITERSAITLWLLNTYDKAGRFRIPSSPTGEGTEDDDVVREEQLISLGGATLGPLLMMKLIFELLVRRAPFFVRPLVAGVRYALNSAFLDAELAHVVGYLDSELAAKDGKGSRKWFLGTEEPTRADFSTLWYLDWANQWGWIDMEKYPRLKEFHARCLERPAWKRALEKGNGYNLKFW